MRVQSLALFRDLWPCSVIPCLTQRSLASLNGLMIKHFHELQCRLKTWLETGIVVAMVSASSCSSNLAPSLGTSICWGWGSKKKKKTFLAEDWTNIQSSLNSINPQFIQFWKCQEFPNFCGTATDATFQAPESGVPGWTCRKVGWVSVNRSKYSPLCLQLN